MKKKVRIYKAPDGKGKFVNKTAKFLRKAQEGGQQDQQSQITDYVYKTLANTDELDMEMTKDSLIGELVAAKIPMDQAEQMVENIAANFESQEPVQEEEEETDVYDEGLAELERQEQEAEEERQAGLAEDYGYYDDRAADGEDEEDEDDDDIPEEVYMQQGGDIIPEDNAVSFTGYDPYEYNQDKQNFYKQGGITKRKYIGQVMKLLKKQAGGEEEKPSAGFDPMDTMDNKKKNKKDEFVAALASSAQEAKMKEKAEAMWEQQQQAMMQQQVPMQPPMEQVPMAQRGMSVRQMRRMMPRGFGRNQMQSFAGMVPQGGFFPMGMNIMTYPQMEMPEQKPIHVQGTMPGMKLDVRKSHWLTGRPSQYSIEYGGDFAIPGFNMMPGKGYGTKSTNRKTIEGVSRIVNKAADPEKKVTDPLTGDKKVVLTTSGTYNMDAPPGTITTVDAQGNEVSKYVPELDLGNKSVDNANPNKDAVGKGAKVPTKTETKKTTTATKSKQVGQTKPATSSAKVTNKGKATVTSSDLINKQKKSGWSNSITGSGTQPSSYDIIPQWLKDSANAPATVQPQPSSSSSMYEDAINWVRSNTGASGSFGDTWGSLFGYQDGGFVDSSNPDLYKFVYGGDDIITQQNMDYSDSKNTGSPFFAKGGYLKQYKPGDEVKENDKDGNNIDDAIEKTPGKNPEEKKEEVEKEETKKPEFQAITSKEDYDKRLAEERKKWQEDYAKQNQSSDSGGGGYDPYGGYVRSGYRPNAFGAYFPANTVRRLGTWSQQQGMPYDPRTGGAYFGGFGPGTQLSKIDVRKSGWLSGRPKKYTMYFNNAEMDPTKPQFSINEGAGASSESGSTSGSTMNKSATNAKDFFGYSDAEWDKKSAREKRQEKRNMKSQEWVDSLPDPEAKTEETTYGPSAEEIAARDAATEANKGVIRNFSEVEGVQDDPFGIGTGGIDEEESIDETTESVTPDVSALRNATASGLPDYNQSVNMMDQLGEDAFNARQQQLQNQSVPTEQPKLSEQEISDLMSSNPFMPGYNPNFITDRNKAAIEQSQIQPEFGANPQIAMGSDFMPQPGAQEINPYQVLGNPSSFPNIFEDQSRRQAAGLYDMEPGMEPLGMDPMNPNYEMAREFSQYSDPFEGFASNDEQYLPGTMDGMSEGSVRNREIAAKQKYDQQQAAIRQQQQQASSGSGSQGSKQSRDINALKEQAFNSDRQGNQAGNWTDDWDIKGVINKNKNQLETLKDSPAGQKTLYAIDTRWQNMSPAQRKNYGDFDNYLKVEGYDKFYNTMQGKIDQIAKPKSKKQKQDSAMEFVPDWMRNIVGKQYGGALSKFVYGDEVTKTSTGTPSPVVYTNNPALEGRRDVDLLGSDDSAITTLQPSSFWSDQESFNKPAMDFQTGCTEEEKKDPKSACYDMEKYGMKVQEDALGSARETTEKKYAPKAGQFAVDFKNKDTYEVDAQGMLLSGNALARGLFDRLEKRGQRRQNKDFYDRFTADNLYASDPSRDRGDYDTNTGLYRPNEQGQIWNSRSKQLGGFMQEGGFAEGDVVDMTPEEIEEFIANGGEIEIIS